MASIIAAAGGELATLLGSSTVEKSVAGSLIGFAASDVLKAIYNDLTGGNATAKAAASRAPQYAIVDMHSNKIVKTLSTRRVYSILTHPTHRRKTESSHRRTVIVPPGSEVVSVR